MARASHAAIRIANLAAVVIALSTAVPSAKADPQQVPQPASGQRTPDNDELHEILVTGSRIARPDDERLNELPAFGEPPNSLVGSQTGTRRSGRNHFNRRRTDLRRRCDPGDGESPARHRSKILLRNSVFQAQAIRPRAGADKLLIYG
jgi:hypothetical protein